MVVVQFFGAILYFYMIIGLGSFFTDKILKESSIRHLFLSFVFGSIITGMSMFALIQMKLVYPYVIYPFVSLFFISSLFKYKSIFFNINKVKTFLYENMVLNRKYTYLFLAGGALILLWLILLAGTPPRAGDVMRYHLTQLKDIVHNHGYVFRPYYHYNFPKYFGYTFLPLYMMLKGVAVQFAVLFCFIFTVFATIRISFLLGLKYLRYILFFILSVPLAFQEAHIAFNDWQVVLYAMIGFMLFLEINLKQNLIFILLPFCSLGYALGIKYQAVLYIPWFIIIAWGLLNESNCDYKKKLWMLSVSLFCMCLIASPFYIRNWMQFKNPLWPLMQDLFYSDKNSYLFKISQRYSLSLKGVHSIDTIVKSFRDLMRYPLIPCSYFILALAGFFFAKRNLLCLKQGLILFFTVLFLVNPKIYWRFGIFVLPFLAVLSAYLLQYSRSKLLMFLFKAMAYVTFSYGGVIACWYSYGLIKPYYIDQDLDEYHKATWYYQEYKWIDEKLPKDAKILVMVSSGHTYYLDREYIRGDIYSAMIEWPLVTDLNKLKMVLTKHEIDYVFYDKAQVNIHEHLQKIFNELITSGGADTIFEKDIQLVYSRIKNRYHNASVCLIKLNDSE